MSGQMMGAVLVGDDDRAVRPAVIWADTRAQAETRVLLDAAPTIVDAVKAGKISRFFVIGGCDGAEPGQRHPVAGAGKLRGSVGDQHRQADDLR